jgi:hypothetical protein
MTDVQQYVDEFQPAELTMVATANAGTVEAAVAVPAK